MKLPMPFETWTTYAGHSGIDFPYPPGTPIRASGPGVIAGRFYNKRGGFYVLVKYDGFVSYVGYYHMPNHSRTPDVGTRVVEGTVIGAVGSSGNSTGPHLHAEVAQRPTDQGFWTYFDKTRWVGQRPAAVTPKPKPKPKPKPDPSTEMEDDMADMLYVYDSAADKGYAIHPVTGKKRQVPAAEWAAIRKNRYPVAESDTTSISKVPNV